jgi:sulfonate transport system substrate-binding protein
MGRVPLLALLTALALGVGWGEERPSEIRIGSGAGATPGRPYASGLMGWVGEHGLLEAEFKADGIPVTWQLIKGAGPGVNEAFANRSVDVALYGDFPALIGRAGGIRTRILLGAGRGNNSYLVVPPDSTARSFVDLKGQRIAIHKGRPYELSFAAVLEQQGLRPTDFKIFNLAPADQAAALAAHSVDALYGAEPYVLEANGTGRIIWSTRDQDPHWRFTAEIFATAEFVAAYPSVTQRIVDVFVRAAHYISQEEHREEWLRFQANASGVPYELVAKEWAGTPLRARNSPLIDGFLQEHYRRSAAFARAKGLVRTDVPDVEGWFAPAFVADAVQRLGLGDAWAAQAADGTVAR